LLLAFGISQLVWGPLSDRFGRRPVLLIGLAVYVVAAIGSALASTMDLLIAWRIAQGVAMGAGVVCARAIVRDLYEPSEGARVMSKGLTGLGVIACASAPLGGLLTDLFHWRVALAALAVFGASALGMLAWRFEESLAPKNPQALQPRALLHTWAEILRHPTFWAYALLATASYGGLFTFLAASSFVFIQVFGLSKTVYGLLMFSMSISYICGTVICRRLLPRFGVRRTVAIAGACTLIAGTSMGVMALLGVQSVWAIMVPFYLFMIGHGVHQPCGQSGAVGPFPRAAGAASALSGFFMMVAAFLMGSWLGKSLAGIAAGQGSVLPLTNGIWFWSVLISGVAWTLVQRYGDNREPPVRRFESPPAGGGEAATGPAKPVPRHLLETHLSATDIAGSAQSKP
jgi:DHA1 family bicyclomycin/chloramphenicol resistance-like MFS transporter